MNSIKTLLLFALITPASAAPGDKPAVRDTLGRFVGDWHMDLYAEPATFGTRGGPGSGTMRCDWGPGETWVDCDLDSIYEGLGRYLLKIVLYRTGRDDTYGAFVTNSFGGGRLYSGRWKTENELVYVDAWLDPARKWEQQRTTYRFSGPDELDFVIEVARDGQDYLPHSRGIYLRK